MTTYPYLIATMTSSWQIGGVTLDMVPEWIDKYKPIQQQGTLQPLMGGGSVMQVFPRNLQGQPITLKFDGKSAVLKPATVDSLRALADAGNVIYFTDGTDTIAVYFDYSMENPLDFGYLDENKVLLSGTIYLRRA